MIHSKKSAVIIALTITTALNSCLFMIPCNTQAVTSQISITEETKSAAPDSQSVYNTLISFKNKYPEGTSWGKDKYYSWKGGIYTGGYSCAAFAFMLSDAAFGNLPARTTNTFSPSTVRVGDIIHYNNHFFVVLEIQNNGFIAAEGNVNGKVMWGRLITNNEIKAAFTQHITRYPQMTIGDSNEDGKIDSADASLILEDYALIQTGKASSLTENRKNASDVNNDGKVDSTDASKILAYYAMLSTGKNPTWN